MTEVIERIKNEPVLASTLVGAVIALLVAFGLDISTEQKTAIIGFVGAILAIVARQNVTPTRKL